MSFPSLSTYRNTYFCTSPLMEDYIIEGITTIYSPAAHLNIPASKIGFIHAFHFSSSIFQSHFLFAGTNDLGIYVTMMSCWGKKERESGNSYGQSIFNCIRYLNVSNTKKGNQLSVRGQHNLHQVQWSVEYIRGFWE